MTKEERSELILKYKSGFAEVSHALEDFPKELLTSHPLAGKWSVCEIVHHLADSETTAALRLRRLLVEARPIIQGYDQDQFAARLAYNEREMPPALQAFESARTTTGQLLDRMSEDDWKREGTHSESGRYTAEDWLRIYADHAHNHAMQIRKLRAALT